MRIKVFSILLLLLTNITLFAHGISDTDKQSMIDGGYVEYVWLGATHMLSGYDHLLFLFGVIFFLTNIKDIFQFISAFTLGHSLTLIFATFMEISANYYLIDALIALTVIYKGFENLDGFKKCFNFKSPNLMFLVFCFGLIHGFGLSTRLQQLPLGDNGLLMKIISFNIGVEVGQILALVVMIFLLSFWRKSESFKRFSVISNTVLIVFGVLLFSIQMHSYLHSINNEELLFSKEKYRTSLSANEMGVKASADIWQDSIVIELMSGESTEYKLKIKKNSRIQYEWVSEEIPLFFDFHGDAGTLFESYEKDTKNESKGEFQASFTGAHGWYWKNKTDKNAKITLKLKGDYKIIGIQ